MGRGFGNQNESQNRSSVSEVNYSNLTFGGLNKSYPEVTMGSASNRSWDLSLKGNDSKHFRLNDHPGSRD
jgi:hypothetical protein